MITFLITMFLFQGVTNFDAMVTWKSGKMYAFSGNLYYRYDLNTNRMDPGYPKYIQGNWQGLPFNKIDAAVNWQNGKAYFFSGNMYVRYDIATDRADPGYPKYIQGNWTVNWNQIDAALYWSGNKAFLFNNASGTYVRYDVKTNKIDPGYPQYTSVKWPGVGYRSIGGATSYGGKGYFTGNGFVRIQVPSGALDPGYPKTLNYLPDVARGGAPAYSTPAPTNTYTPPPPPPANNYRPPPAPANAAGTCKINGTLTFINGGYYQQWNNVQVALYQANAQFNGRLQQYYAQGHTQKSALHAMLKEDYVWTYATSSTTKPTTMNSSKYGMSFSWFGFVSLKPGYYKVAVSGYPNLTRWVNFPANGQSIDVALEHR